MKQKNQNIFPIRDDTEDEIFIICMSEEIDFPKYITNFDDIAGKYDTRYISESYRNLNLDCVRIRSNGELVNIEHHSIINPDLMRRDYEYFTTVYAATKAKLDQFIFYTGKLPVPKVLYANETMSYNPQWFITQNIDGNKRLNNIKYKTDKQLELNSSEIFDLIWLPTFRIDMTRKECVLEISKLYKDIIASPKLLRIAKKCLKLWVGRYIEDSEELKQAARGLKMSELKIIPFEEQLRKAIFFNRLEQAEKEGMEKGIEKGIEKTIPKLLKIMTPQEISQEYEIPLKRVQEIKNGYEK